MATTLEQLVADVLGDQTQAQIKAENPYYTFVAPAEKVSGTLMEFAKPRITSSGEVLEPQYSASEMLPWSIGSGLVSGIMQGLGQDYQNVLTDRYVNTVETGQPNGYLSPALFGSAKRQGQLFSTLRGLELQGLDDQVAKSAQLYGMQLDKQAQLQDAQAKNALMKQVAESVLKNPSRAAKAMPVLQGLFGTGGASAPIAIKAYEQLPAGIGGMPGEYAGSTTGASTPVSDQGRGVEGSLLDDVSAEANKLMDEGAEPAQAFTTAREMLKGKRDELDRQYKRIEDAEKAGQDIKGLVGQMEVALQDAGNTGAFGQLRQWASGWLGLANESQHKKYAAGQNVETFSNEAVKQFGRAFKGPMSDRDVQIMLKAAPSLGTEEETNKAILDRWNFAGELQLAYADFMRAKQAQGVPVSQAESEWTRIRNRNPYVVKTEKGYEINPGWLTGELNLGGQTGASGSWDESPSPSAGVPSVGGNFNGQPVVRVTKKR